MYDQFASDYDRFVNWQNRLAAEIPFIDGLLKSGKPTARILDAACGTGMHTLALYRLGYNNVYGTDISAEMIHKARSNALNAGATLFFTPAGFGSLSKTFGDQHFDALLCLGNSLPHLLTADELKAGLDDFAACLNPGGVLLIQNRNFDSVMKTRNRWMEPQTHDEGEDHWVYFRYYDFNPDGTILFTIVTLKRESGSGWYSNALSTQLRPLLHDELFSALTAAGFTDLRAYGSLSDEPFDPASSSNLVITARKA